MYNNPVLSVLSLGLCHLIVFLLPVSTQLVLSVGLTKGLYASHYCWALDGFNLGGLFYLSLLLRVFYFGVINLFSHIVLTYHHTYMFFEQNGFCFSGL